MRHRTLASILLVVLAGVLAGAPSVRADTLYDYQRYDPLHFEHPNLPANEPSAPALLWRGSGSASLASTRGNTNAQTLNLAAELVRQTPRDQWLWRVDALHSQGLTVMGDSTAADQWHLDTRYDRNLGSRWFGFGGFALEHDRARNLALRRNLSAGPGYHMDRHQTHLLDVFAGLNARVDRFDAPGVPVLNASQMSMGARALEFMLGVELFQQFSPTVSLRARAGLFPTLWQHTQDLQDQAPAETSAEPATHPWRANLNATLAVALSQTLSLSVTLRDEYDGGQWSPNRKNDVSLLTGITYAFDLPAATR